MHLPLEEILIVDNGSKDGTPEENFGPSVNMICHLRNLGTSGSAATAFEYGLSHHYDWVFVLDSDSIPRPDTLKVLIDFYEGFTAKQQAEIGMLSCLSIDCGTKKNYPGLVFTPSGPKLALLSQNLPYYECDGIAWTGSLFKLEAVKKVGLPRFGMQGGWDDFGLDWGDLEYGNRLKSAGYKIIVHQKSIMDHNIGKLTRHTFLGKTVYSSHHSKERRYLYFRNMVYFWLYIYSNKKSWWGVRYFLVSTMIKQTIQFFLTETHPFLKTYAIWKGTWDGLRKKINQPLFKPTG